MTLVDPDFRSGACVHALLALVLAGATIAALREPGVKRVSIAPAVHSVDLMHASVEELSLLESIGTQRAARGAAARARPQAGESRESSSGSSRESSLGDSLEKLARTAKSREAATRAATEVP